MEAEGEEKDDDAMILAEQNKVCNVSGSHTHTLFGPCALKACAALSKAPNPRPNRNSHQQVRE